MALQGLLVYAWVVVELIGLHVVGTIPVIHHKIPQTVLGQQTPEKIADILVVWNFIKTK